MKEISKSNARKLGKNTLLLQTMEECGELIKAISKYNRSMGIGQKTETPPVVAYADLCVELADVSICLEQLIYLMGLEKEIDRLKDKAFDKVAKRYEEANT